MSVAGGWQKSRSAKNIRETRTNSGTNAENCAKTLRLWTNTTSCGRKLLSDSRKARRTPAQSNARKESTERHLNGWFTFGERKHTNHYSSANSPLYTWIIYPNEYSKQKAVSHSKRRKWRNSCKHWSNQWLSTKGERSKNRGFWLRVLHLVSLIHPDCRNFCQSSPWMKPCSSRLGCWTRKSYVGAKGENPRLKNCDPQSHTGRFASDGKVGRAFFRCLPVGDHLVQTRSHRIKLGNPVKAKARIRFNVLHRMSRFSFTGSVRKIVHNTHPCG